MPRSTRITLVMSAVGLSLTACHHGVVRAPVTGGSGPYDGSGATFLALTPVTTDATECKYGISRAESYQPFWGVLVQLVTGGLVSGVTTKYWCVAPPGTGGSSAASAK